RLRGIGAEVLLVDVAVVADDESHHAGLAPAHRPGDDGEPAQHAAVDQVVVGAARRIRALAVEQTEAIAVVAVLLDLAGLRRGDQRAERAFRLPGLALPIEPVLFAGTAQQAPGIDRKPHLHGIGR